MTTGYSVLSTSKPEFASEQRESRSQPENRSTHGPRGEAKDPFYIVKDKIDDAFRSLKTCLFLPQQQVIMKQVQEDIRDLGITIDIVRNNRQKFSISDDELNERSRIVKEFQGDLDLLKQGIQTEVAKHKNLWKQEQARMKERKLLLLSGTKTDQQSSSQQTNQYKEKEQIILQDIDAALKRLHGTSIEIGNEITTSSDMLTPVEIGIDEARGSIQSTIKKMLHLQDPKSENRRYMCIGVLIIIIFVLILVLIL